MDDVPRDASVMNPPIATRQVIPSRQILWRSQAAARLMSSQQKGQALRAKGFSESLLVVEACVYRDFENGIL